MIMARPKAITKSRAQAFNSRCKPEGDGRSAFSSGVEWTVCSIIFDGSVIYTMREYDAPTLVSLALGKQLTAAFWKQADAANMLRLIDKMRGAGQKLRLYSRPPTV